MNFVLKRNCPIIAPGTLIGLVCEYHYNEHKKEAGCKLV